MSKWTDKFNALPMNIRHIGAMCDCETRINQLRCEKKRLKTRYQQSMNEINSHIKSLIDYMKAEENNNGDYNKR